MLRLPPSMATSVRKASSAKNGWIIAPCPRLYRRSSPRQPQLFAHLGDAQHQVAQLRARGPARGLAEAAVRRKREAFRGRVTQALPDAGRDVVDRFEVVALDVDDPHRDVFAGRDETDDVELG